MLSCLYMALFLNCPPLAIFGGDLVEKKFVFGTERLTGHAATQLQSDARESEPAPVEPVTKPVEVEQSETDTDIRETEQPTYRFLGNFETTHYIAMCEEGCTGITATGYDVRNTIYSPEGYRIVAVDPRVVPLNSLLRITYKDGTQFIAKAMDKGGAIKGYKLDFLVNTKKEAYRLGRVTTFVEILTGAGD